MFLFWFSDRVDVWSELLTRIILYMWVCKCNNICKNITESFISVTLYLQESSQMPEVTEILNFDVRTLVEENVMIIKITVRNKSKNVSVYKEGKFLDKRKFKKIKILIQFWKNKTN